MCRSGVGVYSAEAGAESEPKISDSVHLCWEQCYSLNDWICHWCKIWSFHWKTLMQDTLDVTGAGYEYDFI